MKIYCDYETKRNGKVFDKGQYVVLECKSNETLDLCFKAIAEPIQAQEMNNCTDSSYRIIDTDNYDIIVHKVYCVGESIICDNLWYHVG